MGKLNQVVAVEKGLKARSEAAATALYHTLQKNEAFGGISRVYTPRDDEGERLPNEAKRVQHRVPDLLAEIAEAWKPLYDVTLTKEVANQKAGADVVVDGEILVVDAPVSVLLFLEKKLADFATVVRHLPTLDPAFNWTADGTQENIFRTDTVESNRSKKVPRNHVKAPATDRHPAQVEVYYEDIPVGKWETTHLSGAVPLKHKQALLDRVAKLSDAVKKAREEANAMDVEEQKMGKTIFDWLLA